MRAVTTCARDSPVMDEESLRVLTATVAATELREDASTRQQYISTMRDWIEKHPDIRNCRTDDSFLLRFLRVKKFSVPLAQETFLKFINTFKTFKHLVHDLNILDPVLMDIFKTRFMYASPFRDKAGRQVSILTIRNVPIEKYCYKDVGRAVYTHPCTLMEDAVSQVLGHVYIIDASNLSGGHATFWPPSLLGPAIDATQNAFPLRQKEIHLLNVHPVVKLIFQMVVSLLSPKLKDRVFMHTSVQDLHKIVSPDILPKEYGGTMPAEQMSDIWIETMIAKRSLVMALEDIQLNQNTNTNVEVGSFRSLAVD